MTYAHTRNETPLYDSTATRLLKAELVVPSGYRSLLWIQRVVGVRSLVVAAVSDIARTDEGIRDDDGRAKLSRTDAGGWPHPCQVAMHMVARAPLVVAGRLAVVTLSSAS